MLKDYGMTPWSGMDRELCTSSSMDIHEQYLQKARSVFLIYGTGINKGSGIIFVKVLCYLIAILSPEK